MEAQNRAAEVKIRCERRLGQLLEPMDKNTGARGKGVPFHDERTPRLQDLGISYNQSHRWQTIATLEDIAFEAYIAEKRAEEDALTSTGLYRFARELLKPEKAETPPLPNRT
jgi:hypothetical protein